MDFKKQVQEKNEFLKKAYQSAYEYLPSSPLSVSLDPIDFGKSIGFDKDATTRIMQELVDDGYVNSSIGMGMLIVTNEGLNYLRHIETKPKGIMKQSAKLDIILKGLYDFRFDGKYYSVKEILYNSDIEASVDEIFSLGKKLEEDGYIRFLGGHNDVSASITAEGIEYVEDDSYSITGTPITNNNYHISIVNSPNSNLVNQSSDVSIKQSLGDINEVINNIQNTIRQDSEIDKQTADDILECLDEIQQGIKNGNKSKNAIKSLIGMAGIFHRLQVG